MSIILMNDCEMSLVSDLPAFLAVSASV